MNSLDYNEHGEPLTLAHRRYLEILLRDLDCPLSEYSFANLFLFRDVHRYRLRRHPIPHLIGTTYDAVSHVMPLVSLQHWSPAELMLVGQCIYPVTEEVAHAASGVFPMSWYWRDEDSDYIYDVRRMALLDGAVLKPKKREAEAFMASAQPELMPLGSGNFATAQLVLETWVRQRGRCREVTDYGACQEALSNLDSLGLEGLVVIDRDGEPCGFMVYGRVGGGVAVHFAKGDRRRPGVYPYMFSQLASSLKPAWLNFEQDLGKPGLRQAKRALDPLRIMKKCRLHFTENGAAVT